MTIKLTTAEAATLTAIANDSNIGNRDGVQVGTETPLFVAAIPDYVTTIPPASEAETALLTALKGVYTPLIRYLAPISLSASNLSPSFTITAAQTLLTATFPVNFEVARTVQVNVNGTAYSSEASARIDFWITLDAETFTMYKLFFNESFSHRTFSGSWIVTIPVGTTPPVLSVMAALGTGPGSIILDASDFISLTLIG